MHPPFLFWSCQKRNGPCTVQREKTLWSQLCTFVQSCCTGVGVRWCLRVCGDWPTGAAWCSTDLTADSRGAGADENRAARTHLTSSSFRAFRFATRSPGARRGRCPHRPVAEVPSTTGQRQRKEKLDVSQTSPGQRSPQGQRVSVPDCRAGQPTIPRRRQEVCACADRPAEALFLFHRARRILFLAQPKREWGAHPAWTMPLGGSQTPMAAVGKSCLTSKTPAPRRPCRASRRSDRTAGPCRAKPPAAGGWPRR